MFLSRVFSRPLSVTPRRTFFSTPTCSVSGYNVFVRETYDKSLDFKANMGSISQKWKELSDTEREPFVVKAAEVNENQAPRIPKSKVKKLGKPRGPNSYSVFVRNNYEENKKGTLAETSKVLSQLWKSMNQTQKEVYQNLAAEEKARIQKEYEQTKDEI